MVQRTLHPIEGTWLPLKAELDGEHAPDLALTKMSLVLEIDRYAMLFDGVVADAGSLVLSGTPDIRTLTLVCQEGSNKGRTVRSIFQLVGDRLRICFGLDGVVPTEFSAPTGSQRYLVSYRRKT
jgi:uncharacterized protein (TIGR03067 family)